MKLIIHGGFFSESSTSHETKLAKQNALEKIVKKIVDNHNGFITATGELNKGVQFDIYIPIN